MSDKISYEVRGDEFIIRNYNKAKAFASFFPSIAGLWGKPLWVFYVNRGQGISCLGTRDKNGAMLEFVAANKAYRLTPTHGFRTLIKTGKGFYEPFRNRLEGPSSSFEQRMHITSYLLRFVEKDEEAGFLVTAEYFTLPNETIPGLARRLSIKNISSSPVKLECLDGLALFHPYGTNDFLLKNMSRLAEGWFSGVEYSPAFKVPFYKLKVEPEDKPEIFKIEQGNFYAGFQKKGTETVFPRYIIDPDIVFGEMRDLTLPMEYISNADLGTAPQDTARNKTPLAMGYFKKSLAPNEECVYYSLAGHAAGIGDADLFVRRFTADGYYEKKRDENRNLIRSLGQMIFMRSSSDEFDDYAQQTFIDNLLRGGFPVRLGPKVYYAYSRIHGDMEREYNNFVILPEYFSQGTGSYRDVNQNRRSDVFFNPGIKDEAIIQFMNLIQTDGFNPLRILGSMFRAGKAGRFLRHFKSQDRLAVRRFISRPFTLGGFYGFLEKEGIVPSGNREVLLKQLMEDSEKIDLAEAGECYWSDHWHYNIDLIESYLALFPDSLADLLLKKKVFSFYDNPKTVLPRNEKYVLFHNRPRQLKSVRLHKEKQKMIEGRSKDPNLVRAQYGKGKVYYTTLLGKLLCVTANKFASLDPEGMGVEMETDKPNWCDALNGLPGLFGSSTSETLELKRLILFILTSLEKTGLAESREVVTAQEIVRFILDLEKAVLKNGKKPFSFWDATHTIKEKYRARTLFGLSGKELGIRVDRLKTVLKLFLHKIEEGLSGAFDPATGVIHTYFENAVEKYAVLKSRGRDELPAIRPLAFRRIPLKLFLEGPVHYLRVSADAEAARKFHQKVMKSRLYDAELKMLKVNEPLEKTGLDVGRITVFTPGWLENESVWLHMEYKYLLELLRKGMPDEFFRVMKDMLVPFMDPHVYGRSIFENSSFLASSSHPEKSIHGQGFVARLSGSTAEFISMWIAMTSGLSPFFLRDNRLFLHFKPLLPAWLFTKRQEKITLLSQGPKPEEIVLKENSFLFRFLGSTTVVYSNPRRRDTFGRNRAVMKRIKLTYDTRKTVALEGDLIPPPYSLHVRENRIRLIEIIFD